MQNNMKKNRKGIIVLILLSLVGIWLFINNNQGSIREELKDFAFEDTASITKIFMADKENHTVLLEKVSPGNWKLNNKYKARKNAINLLLLTIKNLEVKSPVGKPAQENIIKRLASTAVKIEIYDKEELRKVYFVGGETSDQLGTYMLLANSETMENSSIPFIVHLPGFNGYLTPRYFTSEIDWRERTTLSYVPTEIKTVKIEVPQQPELSYEIHLIENNKYDIKQTLTRKSVENYDLMALKQYLSFYQNVAFGSIENELSGSQKDSIIHSTPRHIITITDLNGKINRVRLFLKAAPSETLNTSGQTLKYDQERMYALINDEMELVSAQYFIFGKLLPSLDYFRTNQPLP